MVERDLDKRKDVVYELSRASRCDNCDRRLEPGEIVKLRKLEEEQEAYCRACSNLDCLEIVRPGNAKITRLSMKYSQQKYVIVKWSDAWKCYERQGILVEPAAVDKAEIESGAKLGKREQVSRDDFR